MSVAAGSRRRSLLRLWRHGSRKKCEGSALCGCHGTGKAGGGCWDGDWGVFRWELKIENWLGKNEIF